MIVDDQKEENERLTAKSMEKTRQRKERMSSTVCESARVFVGVCMCGNSKGGWKPERAKSACSERERGRE